MGIMVASMDVKFNWFYGVEAFAVLAWIG